jgi:energy-coupling factor transporter transmembrane protein EcfT
MGSAAALLLAGSFCAGIRPWELLAGSRPLLLMLAAVTVFRSVHISLPLSFNLETTGLMGALIFDGGILISFAGGSLFFSVTTMTAIRRSLEKVELFILRPFGAKKRHGSLSLALALMLGFLPRFFEFWETSELACKARLCKSGLRRTCLVLPLVTERMIEMAAETAIALESRGLTL